MICIRRNVDIDNSYYLEVGVVNIILAMKKHEHPSPQRPAALSPFAAPSLAQCSRTLSLMAHLAAVAGHRYSRAASTGGSGARLCCLAAPRFHPGAQCQRGLCAALIARSLAADWDRK